MKKFLLFISCLCFNIGIVYAAPSASISVNKSRVENGSSVSATVTVKSTAAWNIRISSSGATSGCTQKFADATSNGQNTTKSFTVTCKATSLGTINFTMTGDITDASGNNISVSGSRNVSVVKPREKSSNNYLSSLSSDIVNIDFDKEVLDYSVVVKSNVNKLDLVGVPEDSKATVTILDQSLKSNKTKIKVMVKAEDGNERIYTVTVNKKNEKKVTATTTKKSMDSFEKSSKLKWGMIFFALIIIVIIDVLYIKKKR